MATTGMKLGQQTAAPSPSAMLMSYADVVFFCRKYWRRIAVYTALGVAAATLYVISAEPTYTARAQLLIERAVPQGPREHLNLSVPSIDTAQIESQIAVLRSEKVARMVIDELDLLNDPEFREGGQSQLKRLGERFAALVPAEDSVLGSLMSGAHGLIVAPVRDSLPSLPEIGLFTRAERVPPSDLERMQYALDSFAKRMDVRRLNISHAIEVSFDSSDPDKAASLANATASAYLQEQIESKSASEVQGIDWMENRIRELRGEMNQAMLRVQEFRARHDYSVGGFAPPPSTENPVGEATDASRYTLEELEATADAYRRLYESFIEAYAASTRRQSYAVADARIITLASRPRNKSRPQGTLIVALGGMLGLIGGAGISLARHALDRTVHSSRQVRQHLGLECLGGVPPVRTGWWSNNAHAAATRDPFSPFGDSLRSVKTAISLASGPRSKTLGITSARPGEGKTTITSNLGALFAMGGSRTLVVDADVYTCGLSRLIAPDATEGIAQAVESPADALDLIVPSGLGFDFLPSQGGRLINSAELLGSAEMRTLIRNLSKTYDTILFDLPPVRLAADGLALSPLLNGVVIVAEWTGTELDEVAEVAWSLTTAKATVRGVVMNRVSFAERYSYGRGTVPVRLPKQAS